MNVKLAGRVMVPCLPYISHLHGCCYYYYYSSSSSFLPFSNRLLVEMEGEERRGEMDAWKIEQDPLSNNPPPVISALQVTRAYATWARERRKKQDSASPFPQGHEVLGGVGGTP